MRSPSHPSHPCAPDALLERPLVTSRLLQQVHDDGKYFATSPTATRPVLVTRTVRAILEALWPQDDARPTPERLSAAGLSIEEATPGVRELWDAGLLCSAGTDELTPYFDDVAARHRDTPRVDQIELTNACPLTCPFCPRGLGKMARPIGFLDLELLRDILAQVREHQAGKSVGLHHFGDPILHPRAPDAIRMVREAGLHSEISFNPVLLKKDLGVRLLEAGPGTIIVSLDGLDTATLQLMRGRAAGLADEALRKIDALVQHAARLPSPPEIIISMVATKLNQHQWRDFFEQFEKYQLPWVRVQVRPVLRLLNDFGDGDVAPLGVKPLRTLCIMPHFYLSVLWDGTVVPCCNDSDGATPLGDLTKQTLLEVWQGEVMERFRRRWRSGEFAENEPCSTCTWRPDRFVAQPVCPSTDAWTKALWDFPAPEPPRGEGG